MCTPKALVLALALAAAISPALAADLVSAPPPYPEAAPVAEIGGGWYLRGDIGYVDYVAPKEDKSRGFVGAPLTGLKLDETWSIGGGIGYRVNDWFRVDVTGSYRPEVTFVDRSSRTNFAEGFNQETGKYQVNTAFANAYLDLGTWYGFTPYVGGGVGVADYRFSKVFSETTCTTVTCGDPAGAYAIGPQGNRLYRTTRSNAQFAWALMAGVSKDLGHGLSLDAGYRYANLGQAQTGYDAYAFNTRLKDIETHEVRIGLRWAFADYSPASAVVWAPRGY